MWKRLFPAFVKRFLNAHVRPRLMVAMRAYVRYFPIRYGKHLLWRTVIEPQFSWVPHKFVTTTVFGSKFAGDTTDLLQHHLYYFGIWQPELTRFMADRLSPGDVFVDVGANIGYFSLYASRLLRGTGSVVAIEASPSNFRELRANLRRNGVGNVRAVNVAAAERKSRLRVYQGPVQNRGRTTVVPEVAEDVQFECEIEALPLGEILSSSEIENARLVKVDVEGAEWSVAQGMAGILNRGREDLEVVMEVSPLRLAQQGRSADDLLRFFSDAGFHPYGLETDYAASTYLLSNSTERPIRIHGTIADETDVVFSRRDQGSL